MITLTETILPPSTLPCISGIIDHIEVITNIVNLKKMMNITTDSAGKKCSQIIILDLEFIDFFVYDTKPKKIEIGLQHTSWPLSLLNIVDTLIYTAIVI